MELQLGRSLIALYRANSGLGLRTRVSLVAHFW
jgi:hypothetical protein